MKDKKAAKKIIKIAKTQPNLYTKEDVKYAKLLRKRSSMKNRDTLKINQNNDGSFTAEWDKNDPEWSFLNGKTSKEIQEMIEDIMKTKQEEDDGKVSLV